MTPLDRDLLRRAARRRLKRNYSLIAMHALYQRWGLPTRMLAPLVKPRKRLALELREIAHEH